MVFIERRTTRRNPKLYCIFNPEKVSCIFKGKFPLRVIEWRKELQTNI